MDAAQRRRMLIADQSLGDIVAGPGRSEGLTVAGRRAGGDLGAAQRELLVALVETYARNMRAEVADEELRRVRDGGRRAPALRVGRPDRARARATTTASTARRC